MEIANAPRSSVSIITKFAGENPSPDPRKNEKNLCICIMNPRSEVTEINPTNASVRYIDTSRSSTSMPVNPSPTATVFDTGSELMSSPNNSTHELVPMRKTQYIDSKYPSAFSVCPRRVRDSSAFRRCFFKSSMSAARADSSDDSADISTSNPEMSCRIRRVDPAAPMALTNLENRPEPYSPDSFFAFNSDRKCPTFAAFCFLDTPACCICDSIAAISPCSTGRTNSDTYVKGTLTVP